MAVAAFKREGEELVRKGFHPPKRASLRAWYNAATATIAGAPKFNPLIEARARVDNETIMFEAPDVSWTLFIARKRNL